MKLGYLSVLAWTALILLVAEVGLEARANRRGFGSILFGPAGVRYAQQSGTKALLPEELGPTADFPFRSPVVSPSKAEGAIRVWFGSASHGEDLAVPVQRVFPNHMGEVLRGMGIAVEVLNASRAGLTISANAQDLSEIGPIWAPDLAILYGASMDLGVLSERFLSGGGGPQDQDTGQTAENRDALVSGPFRRLDRIYEETTTYAQLKSNITTLVTRQRLLADSIPSAAAEHFREEVNRFVDAALEVGAVPVLTTFTTSYGWDATLPLPLAAEKFMVRYNPYLEPKGWLKAVHTLNMVLRKVADERSLLLLDLENEFTNQFHLFRDPVHFTPNGHRAVAAFLAQGLAEAFGWGRAAGSP